MGGHRLGVISAVGHSSTSVTRHHHMLSATTHPPPRRAIPTLSKTPSADADADASCLQVPNSTGQWCACSSIDNTIRLWDLESRQLTRTIGER